MNSSTVEITLSIPNTTSEKMIVPISTKVVLFCNSLKLGQVALTANSCHESCNDVNILLIFFILCTDTRIRTLINGFGDRYSTLELRPYIFRTLIKERKSSESIHKKQMRSRKFQDRIFNMVYYY